MPRHADDAMLVICYLRAIAVPLLLIRYDLSIFFATLAAISLPYACRRHYDAVSARPLFRLISPCC